MYGRFGGGKMVERKRHCHIKIGKIYALFFFFLLKAFHGSATEYQPWLGNFLEFESRTSLLYQDYTAISSGPHIERHTANDLFLNISLSNTLFDFLIEFEATEARTRRQRGDIDQLKVTGRYVWQNDIIGDPFSFATGVSFIECFQSSLKDLSSFHHGRSEAEFFCSFGKETPQETTWISRWWGIAGIGVADRGSPWARFNLVYERQWREKHELKVFSYFLWGFGHKRLHICDFHGYGPIQHQSLDLGLRYTYLIDFFGSASLEYSYRIYARNFPVRAHRVCIQLLYTFGL